MLRFNRTHRRRFIKSEKAQSMLETAFGMVVLVFMLLGMLDLGRMYFTYVALEDAAGEAAIFLAINPTCPYDGREGGDPLGTPLADAADGTAADTTGTGVCEIPNNAVWRAQEAGGSLIEWTDTLLVYDITEGAEGTGDYVRVDLEYPFPLLFPVIPEIAGTPTLTLRASASQTVVIEE